MRAITKGSGPAFLAAYKISHKGDWKALTTPDKQKIRTLLVREQQGLCAYCMRRIHENPTPTDHTKIEHIVPQSEPDTVFDWDNLVACCNGNEGHPAKNQTCDTKKGGKSLSQLNVLAPQSIYFGKASGQIGSAIDAVHRDLEHVLNLNDEILVNERKKVIEGLSQTLTKDLRLHGRWRREQLQRFLNRQKSEQPAPPHLGVIEHLIELVISKSR